MRARAVLISVLAVALLSLAAAPAAAAMPGMVAVPMGVLGIDFPSVKSIVSDVVKFFFTTFLDALVPGWLKHGSVQVIRRLVTVPNPTDARVWPTLGQLSEGMRWIALPLLSLAAVASWVQQWLREWTGRPGSIAVVLPRTILAGLLLVAYPTVVANAVALVNSITNAMLSLPAVEHGLQRTVGIVFAGTLLTGDGLLLALLGIAAVVLAVGLFMLSVGVLTVFAIAFVSAPIAIVCSVLDETHGIWRAWRFTLLAVSLISVGWCVLFSTSGAFMLDITRWSGGIAGALGAHIVGVFAALIILGLALRWPFMVLGGIRTHLAGALLSIGRGSAYGYHGGASSAGGRAARATLQRTALRAGDAVTGALGATRLRAATSARMALTDGGRLLARLPGAGAVLAAGAGAAAAVGSRLAPATAAAAPAGRAARAGAEQVRARLGAAAAASKTALAEGATGREAVAAGVEVATRPSRQAPQDLAGAGPNPGAVRQRATQAERPGRPSPAAGRSAQPADAQGSPRASATQRATRHASALQRERQVAPAAARRPNGPVNSTRVATAARRPDASAPVAASSRTPAGTRPVPPSPVPARRPDRPAAPGVRKEAPVSEARRRTPRPPKGR